jgi:tripartite ATP-independent transporter DctP family solute receptor
MKSFKKSALVLLLIIMVTPVAIFANGDSETKGDEGSKNYKITFNEPFSKPHTLALAAEKFGQLVEERTDGKVEVEVYYGGVLGTSREALEAVQVGTQTMVDAATAPIVAFEPSFGVLNLPYLFSSRQQWYGALDSNLGDELLDKLEDKGFVGLAYLENGVRHVTNNVKPIIKWEDLKGIKIRLMQNPTYIATFENFGCLTTTTPWSELYSALQQNVVDAQENPVSNIVNGKIYEVQKYLSLTGHTYDPNIYFINKKYFDSLPANYQEIIRSTAKEVATWQREQAISTEKDCLVQLGETMEINEVSASELARFKEQSLPIYESEKKSIGEDIVNEWLEAVK